MTHDDLFPAPIETPVISSHASMVKASLPMGEAQLLEFAARLRDGWKPVVRIKPTTDKLPTNRLTSELLETELPATSVSSNHSELVNDILQWILATLDLHGDKDPRTHADAAIAEFLDIPCSNDQLLSFFRSFATAYEIVVRQKCDLSAFLRPGTIQRITIANATEHRDATLRCLNRLALLERERPDVADVFRLWEFAGCSADELARYLALAGDAVSKAIEDSSWDIYDEEHTA